MLIDLLVLAPILAIEIWLGSDSKSMAIVLLVPVACIHVGYFVYSHGRFGQTIGKYLVGIRVVKRNGEVIGWQEAWLRSSFDVLFVSFSCAAAFIVLTTIADRDYYNVGWSQRSQNLYALRPAWVGWTDIASQIWTWSEVVVMLFNRERRALHDFIAGTIVIALPRAHDQA